MAKKIYLSPSNQGRNTYATGNTNEMAQCDKIAAATAIALKRCGFEVMVAKSGTLMEQRCPESDKFGADIHMPIHTNAYNGTLTGGTRVFCLNSNGDRACKAVVKHLGAISPGSPDGIYHYTNLYEINVPKALTVYVEVEFHDTATGSNWIINNTSNIAEAIAKAMCEYFGYTYKAPSTNAASSDKTLDTKGYKQGDGQTGVLYLKELLRLAKVVGVHDKPVSEDNDEFGKSVTVAVNACLKKWGYKENGIAGLNFARKLTTEIKKNIK